MMDELEEQSGEGLDIPRYLGVVKRRHIQFLIPLFIGWTIVWAASWVLPPRYQSTTLILVEHLVKAVFDISDRVVVLNSGEKLAEGLPQEIVTNPAVITAYLGEAVA